VLKRQRKQKDKLDAVFKNETSLVQTL